MTLRFVVGWTVFCALVAYSVGFCSGATAERQRVFTYKRAAPSSCATADGGSGLCFQTGTVLESTDFPKGTFR